MHFGRRFLHRCLDLEFRLINKVAKDTSRENYKGEKANHLPIMNFEPLQTFRQEMHQRMPLLGDN
jgi:hypothetical protein